MSALRRFGASGLEVQVQPLNAITARASLTTLLLSRPAFVVLAPFSLRPTPLAPPHLPHSTGPWPRNSATDTSAQHSPHTTRTCAMSRLQQDQFVDDEEEECCPLCVEEFDLSDRNFRPCPCGYQVRPPASSRRTHLELHC